MMTEAPTCSTRSSPASHRRTRSRQTGVGWSGLPNADGVVQLDACCMHGPKKRAGGVAAIEGVRTPAKVAQLVAQRYRSSPPRRQRRAGLRARDGLQDRAGLDHDVARQRWLEWKRRTDPLHYLDPKSRAQAWYDAGLQMVREGLIAPKPSGARSTATASTPKGEICGVTTTSGLAWKIPGRAGDSPILGAGLYVDGEVGAAGSTGRGEANLYNLSSFLIVEEMRRGAHPKDAAMTALKRVAKNTIEKRLLNSKGQPNFGLSFYCLNAKGEYAGVAMYESTTPSAPRTVRRRSRPTRLFPGRATDA